MTTSADENHAIAAEAAQTRHEDAAHYAQAMSERERVWFARMTESQRLAYQAARRIQAEADQKLGIDRGQKI